MEIESEEDAERGGGEKSVSLQARGNMKVVQEASGWRREII